ncbi:hypothetical protein NUACC21_74320 [Scytonema sp. NUACC21]
MLDSSFTQEEIEIIRRFRQLSKDNQNAIIASENSFRTWIKQAAGWVIGKISWEALKELFNYISNNFSN